MSGFSLSDLAAGGMGDHMRVGPQWIEASNRGLPIVQRGPHGQRIAPLPTRDEQGVRWWKESMVADASYLPQQQVVGIMGMGAMGGGSVAPEDVRKRLTTSTKAQLEQVDETETSNTYRLSILIEAAEGRIRELERYQPWPRKESWGGFVVDYWSSTEIRNESYVAKQRALKKLQSTRGIQIRVNETTTRGPGSLEEQQAHSAMDVSARPEAFNRGYATNVARTLPGSYVEAGSEWFDSIVSAGKKEANKTKMQIAAVALVGIGIYAYLSAKGRGPTIQIGS